MIYNENNRWILKDETGLRFFNTQEEAAKAAGLVVEKDYAEEDDIEEETYSDETSSYLDRFKK